MVVVLGLRCPFCCSTDEPFISSPMLGMVVEEGFATALRASYVLLVVAAVGLFAFSTFRGGTVELEDCVVAWFVGREA